MDDQAIRAQIEQSKALLAETDALLARQAEVFAVVKAALAAQAGCAPHELAQAIDAMIAPGDREAAQQMSQQMLRDQVPELDLGSGASAPRAVGSEPTAPRPRRRMV